VKGKLNNMNSTFKKFNASEQGEIIAIRWLRDCEKRIASGKQTYKISEQPDLYFAELIESGTGTKASLQSIKSFAIQAAKEMLISGQYPVVLNHFTK
jgi:hypothetical protein